eukprot:s4326_g3.t1
MRTAVVESGKRNAAELTTNHLCSSAAMVLRRLRYARAGSILLMGSVVLGAFKPISFTGSTQADAMRSRRRTHMVETQAAEKVPELPPFKQFPDDYDPDPLDKFIEFLMSMDPETNQLFEQVATVVLLGITAYSGKVTYDKWQVDKKEEDEFRRQKIARALNPDGWRQELFQEDELEQRKQEQQQPKNKVKDVLKEIYSTDDPTDGLTDGFDAYARPGRATSRAKAKAGPKRIRKTRGAR